MKLTIDILRQKDSASAPYKQTIELDARPDDTVATLLNTINARDDLKDINGEPVGTIHWQCSCLQKKCGACAMRINGDPALACDTKLSACKRGKLSLEPLRKFPTVRDLIVDRSLMMDNLRTIHNWLEQSAHHSGKAADLCVVGLDEIHLAPALDIPNLIVNSMGASDVLMTLVDGRVVYKKGGANRGFGDWSAATAAREGLLSSVRCILR